jgi:hypothetical protein
LIQIKQQGHVPDDLVFFFSDPFDDDERMTVFVSPVELFEWEIEISQLLQIAVVTLKISSDRQIDVMSVEGPVREAPLPCAKRFDWFGNFSRSN